MAYSKEIIISFIIIFLTITTVAVAAGGYMFVIGKIDVTQLAALLALVPVAAGGICYAMLNNVRYVEGIVCPYGVYPKCAPARYALEKGFRNEVD